MSRPRLLMLDEPSLGLAPLIVREIFRIVRELNERDGLAVLVVEQDAAHRPRRRASRLRPRGRRGRRSPARAPSCATTNPSARATSATDGRLLPTGGVGARLRRHLRLARARARPHPSRDGRHQLRAGGDGDVLDVHPLDADREPRLAVLARRRCSRSRLVRRRFRHPPARRQAGRARLGAARRDRHDRPAADAQRAHELDLVRARSTACTARSRPARSTSAASPSRSRTSARSASRSGSSIVLWLFFRFTKVGLALRAAATNPAEARLVGVRVPLAARARLGSGRDARRDRRARSPRRAWPASTRT